jgi:glycosyltransferase involved in cell wall biosynthesis
MPEPLVSIMMPAYNAAEFIGQAIESVLAQTYPHWELIIINDGSTDNTAEIAGYYSDARIRLINQPNGGESTARNTALAHMQGELVAFLDADDAYLPGHLAETVAYLNQHPGRDAVYTDGYHIDQAGRQLQTLSSRRRGPFEGWIFEQVVRASDVFGPPMTMVIRRKLFTAYQLGFDNRIIIGPDWDFEAHLTEHASFGYLDRPTCLYRVHTSNISVLTGMQKRRLSLAICREKAIHLPSFAKCASETRTYVFYDLLVNQLIGLHERQEDVTQWDQFKALPGAEQARILRLMAGTAAATGNATPSHITRWLARARQLQPGDLRNTAIEALYRINPGLCSRLLQNRYRALLAALDAPPFADLQ